jgi:biotin carboxyl carrier protein
MDVAQLDARRSPDAEPPPGGSGDDSRREAHLAHGERLGVPERVILAPIAGSFRPVRPDEGDGDGDDIDPEQVIGFVEGQGQSAPVRSPFGGLLMGLLAHAGERVREGQPVAWLRIA